MLATISELSLISGMHMWERAKTDSCKMSSDLYRGTMAHPYCQHMHTHTPTHTCTYMYIHPYTVTQSILRGTMKCPLKLLHSLFRVPASLPYQACCIQSLSGGLNSTPRPFSLEVGAESLDPLIHLILPWLLWGQSHPEAKGPEAPDVLLAYKRHFYHSEEFQHFRSGVPGTHRD